MKNRLVSGGPAGLFGTAAGEIRPDELRIRRLICFSDLSCEPGSSAHTLNTREGGSRQRPSEEKERKTGLSVKMVNISMFLFPEDQCYFRSCCAFIPQNGYQAEKKVPGPCALR